MYDYMQALQDKFFPDTAHAKRRGEIEAMRRKLSRTLDRQHRKQLLQIVDAQSQLCDDRALASFIAGFRLACGIASELGKDNWYSYEEQFWKAPDERRAD